MQTLEAIELLTRRHDFRTKPMAMVNKHLRKHYIQKRSVIFIVDNCFDSVFYSQKAYDFVRKVYKGLSPDDYFGMITYGAK